jgi:hypothetical protein
MTGPDCIAVAAAIKCSCSCRAFHCSKATWNRFSGLRGNTYTSHDPSPCKRLKDGNGADSRKSQSAASPGRQQQICAGSPVTGLISQNFPPDLRAPASKSLRLGWDFHTSANFFQICPRPLAHTAVHVQLYTCRTKHSGHANH